MLFVIGASGKLGFATLTALLDQGLIPANQIVCTTSSASGASKLAGAKARGVEIRSGEWDDTVEQWTKILASCTKLYLISSARIERDFGEPHPAQGREADHFKVLEAARMIGVRHIYYTSLAFANPSRSRVMTAHERTEDWLRKSSMTYTILREGLYNESWPLYFGHYDTAGDERQKIVVSGDSKISWTSIPDLGLATAVILAANEHEWAGKCVYLSQAKAHSLADVARMVTQAGKKVELEITSREEYERHYTAKGMDQGMIKWWARTYDALQDTECEIHDTTLESLLSARGVAPKQMDKTVAEMMKAHN